MKSFELVLDVLGVLLLSVRVRLYKLYKAAYIDYLLLLRAHLGLNLLHSLGQALYLEATCGYTLQLHLQEAHVSIFVSSLLQVLLRVPYRRGCTEGRLTIVASHFQR